MRTLASVAVALASVATPASAQRATEAETGSLIPIPQRARIPEQGSMKDANRIRITMAQFARCVVDREPRRVEQTLALPFGTPFDHAVVALATSECLDSGQIRFKAVAIRGPLFTELYRRRAIAERSRQAWGPVLAKINFAALAATTDASVQQYLGLVAFGDCVVGRDAEAARRVVLAPTASDAQDRTITAITPNLGPCIVQGTTLRFGKQVLEGVLAEVLYRGVDSPAVAAAASAKGSE